MEHSKQRERTTSGEPNSFVTSLIGGLVGLGVTLVMILVLPFALLGLDDPNSLTLPISCFCALAGGAIGSLFAVKKGNEQPIRSALISSGVMLLPIIAVSFFVPGEGSFLFAAAVIASVALGSAAVTVILTRSSKSRKRRMKNVMKRR